MEQALEVIYRDAFFAGDKVKITWMCAPTTEYENYYGTDLFEQKDFEIELAGVVSDLDWIDAMYSFTGLSGFCFVTTETGMHSLGIEAVVTTINVNLRDAADADAQNSVMEQLEEVAQRVTRYSLFSSYEWRLQEDAEQRQFTVGLLALLLLFFCITAASLCNATNAKIRESRRSIGTLRAVGADASTLRKIYFRQYAAIFGIGLGVGCAIVAMVRIGTIAVANMRGTSPILPEIPLWPSAIFVAAVVGVVLCNLVARLRRETRRSIVENIREL